MIKQKAETKLRDIEIKREIWVFSNHRIKENNTEEDANASYRTIEEQIVPIYYIVSEPELPVDWVSHIKGLRPQ